jgi:polysaccharide export outer membrane protein
MKRASGVWAVLALLAAIVLSACASNGAKDAVVANDAGSSDAVSQLDDYRLGPSDKVRLIVYGEPDLSGEFSINARGQISLPLLGEVDAAGMTIEEMRKKVSAGLSAGYVKDARVAAEVVEYRPYYILGEVGAPGEYPYSSGITVFKAVAAAKGFSYRANKGSVFIKRANSDEEVKYKLTQSLLVFPGDVVRVSERFF